MSKLETHWQRIKTKKFLLEGWYKNLTAHHPCRLKEITCSGTMSLTIDERLQYSSPPSEGTRANLSVFSLTMPSEFSFERKWDKEELGLYRQSPSVADPPEPGKFYWQHQPRAPWRVMNMDFPASTDVVEVGSINITRFEYKDDAWEQIGSPTTGEVLGYFVLISGVGGGSAGGSALGGYDEGNPDARLTITYLIEMGPIVHVGQPKRYPWEDNWEPDGSFEETFEEYLEALNAGLDAPIASGSSDIALNFIF